jgi:hypothetical protein
VSIKEVERCIQEILFKSKCCTTIQEKKNLVKALGGKKFKTE